ncbi:hybrid sensor histidine kinase/response regulator [Caldimonas tepidiphila]|uniref:hybrid sensor histidine kinase/response regulator n=1 Tax=Caldimonas tepidiphila TaxID=2315841 RepID=UPI0013002D30|nr:response regulator [Caldimonas tepidiphila]
MTDAMDEVLRILLVDDNPDDRALALREIRKVLPAAVVDEVGDGERLDALIASGADWDVAVTDYLLRWSTGLEVFDRLRRERPGLPVIMFTASGSEEIAVAALKQGLDDYITKTAKHYGRIPYAVRACAERRRRRREAEAASAALRQHKAMLQLAMEAAALEAWEHDLETGSTVLHGRSEQVFDGIRREMGLERLLGYLHPEDHDRVRAQFLAAAAGVARFDAEFRVLPQGRERWLRATAIVDAGEGRRRLVGVIEDITRRKRQEQQLREADRQKDQFIATLAHELRNPLAPIRYVAHLLQPGAPESSVVRAREVIERQSALMGRLLDDLLDVSRITLNRIELRRERLDLREVLGRAVEDIRPLADASGHALSLAQPAAALWVDGDEVRLHEIVDNLLHNAIKFTPRGGRLSLALGHEGGDAVLCVLDNGVGIVPDMLERVFEPFVQVSAGPGAASPGGLGIGLAVVKRLVALHGGEIEARSAGLGQGAEFVVRLPLSEAPAAAPSATGEVAAEASWRKPRVLVADDQPDAAESLALVLELQGHAVLTAFDGLQAQRVAERERPEVMVLDIGMPGLGGDELARWVRSQPWGAGVHLVAVTGWGRDEDRRRLREAGFDAHLVKPVDVDELLQAVERRRRS